MQNATIHTPNKISPKAMKIPICNHEGLKPPPSMTRGEALIREVFLESTLARLSIKRVMQQSSL